MIQLAQDVTSSAIDGLISSGPLAAVLAAAVWILWRKLETLETRHEEAMSAERAKRDELYKHLIGMANEEAPSE